MEWGRGQWEAGGYWPEAVEDVDSAVDNVSPETQVSAGPAVVSLDNRCEPRALGEAGDGRGLGEGVRVVPAERSVPELAVP